MWWSPWGTSQRTGNSKGPVHSQRGVSQGTPRRLFLATRTLDPWTGPRGLSILGSIAMALAQGVHTEPG